MRTPGFSAVLFAVFSVPLAFAGSAQAADGFDAGHRSVGEDGKAAAKPMSWRYGLLLSAQERFEEGAAKQAPGAVLVFRLPKTDAGEPGHRVDLVTEADRIPLRMVSGAAFMLPPATDVVDEDAQVVANRHFRDGEFNHPNVQVRSPGLPEGVRRVGDLRLACVSQMAMAKAEGFKFRAALATASLFGLDLCEKLEIAKFDAPKAKYDTVTFEDEGRRLVLSASMRDTPPLGDKGWSDNARVTYSLDGRIVQ